MEDIPELTIEEARELGFEIELIASTDDDCRVNVSVTAPETLNSARFVAMSHAFYRGDDLLFLSDATFNQRKHSVLIASEMLTLFVVLAVYDSEERGFGQQILFTSVEWNCDN